MTVPRVRERFPDGFDLHPLHLLIQVCSKTFLQGVGMLFSGNFMGAWAPGETRESRFVPQHFALNPQPSTIKSQPYTLHPELTNLDPEPSNHKPLPLNPRP